jgi:hypothetical protein
VRTSAFALCGCLIVLVPKPVVAQDETRAPDAQIEMAEEPPAVEKKGSDAVAVGDGAMATDASLGEAPPPRPRHKGVVLESTLGVLAFGGRFRHVAPPASFLHTQLGYELLSWLMVFGEAELAFTDTSESQDVSGSRAFPLYGFGGGVRVGPRIGTFGMFMQADVGALAAEVPHGALADLGFRGAESLGVVIGGRVGLEWYQRDRHLALTLQGGPRLAQGFSKLGASADVPIMWDVAAGLRYTF